MRWDGPILTDSGGYQVFSLAHQRNLADDGVTFRSHLDGSIHSFTPEKVMEVEMALGADIAMVLDVCPNPTDRAAVEDAVARTHRWAERCRTAHNRTDRRSLALSRAASSPTCAGKAPTFCARLTFRATPWAGWPWARQSSRCTPRWMPQCRSCPRTSRAT